MLAVCDSASETGDPIMPGRIAIPRERVRINRERLAWSALGDFDFSQSGLPVQIGRAHGAILRVGYLRHEVGATSCAIWSAPGRPLRCSAMFPLLRLSASSREMQDAAGLLAADLLRSRMA
jgi:hypothetical protein